jgi:hypothetical protein
MICYEQFDGNPIGKAYEKTKRQLLISLMVQSGKATRMINLVAYAKSNYAQKK